jgi:hypothetical protein
MSAKSIYGADFQFNRIHFNNVTYEKYFNSSIILNDLQQLNFSDGSYQTTAYLGNSPNPQNYTYNIMPNINLICSNGVANLQNEIIIFNSNTGFQGSLYFNDSNNDLITNFNIIFSNSFNDNLIITLLNNMTVKPSYSTSSICYIIDNFSGIMTYGSIILLSNGDLTINFNNIQIINSSIYTIYIYSFKFN